MTESQALLVALCKNNLIDTPEGIAKLVYVVDDGAWVRLENNPKILKYFKLKNLVPYFYLLNLLTEEEKAEFCNIFEYKLVDKLRYVSEGYIEFEGTVTDHTLDRDENLLCIANTNELVWFMSRGFYCGQAPPHEWKIRKR